MRGNGPVSACHCMVGLYHILTRLGLEEQGRGDGPEAGTSGASEAARASCRLGSPGVLPPPREFF